MTSFSFSPLNTLEIQSWVESAQFLVGARLQQAFWTEEAIKLHFFKHGQNYLVLIDLRQASPYIYIEMQGAKKGSAHKPLLLFLKSHFYGKILTQVLQPEPNERKIRFIFEEGYLEAQLIPHNVNFSAQKEKSIVYFRKPRETISALSDSTQLGSLSARPLEEILSSYLQLNSKKSSLGATVSQTPSLTTEEKALLKQKQKLESLIKKLDEEIEQKSSFDFSVYEQLAQKIQNEGLGALSQEQQVILKNPRSMGDALSYIYSLSKKNELKLQGVRQRRDEIKLQLDSLTHRRNSPLEGVSKNSVRPSKGLLELSEAKGRTLKQDGLLFYVGKSAADNLSLLRRAQSHDIWIHLRDYPSAHGILRNGKNQIPSFEVLKKCSQFLVKNTFSPEKWPTLTQTKFEVIYTECRHVRPIKGGALGTVIYRNEKSFLLTFDPAQV